MGIRTATGLTRRRASPRQDQRLVSWLVEGEPGGEREILAYAAGSLIGIAVATAVLMFVVGWGLISG